MADNRNVGQEGGIGGRWLRDAMPILELMFYARDGREGGRGTCNLGVQRVGVALWDVIR